MILVPRCAQPASSRLGDVVFVLFCVSRVSCVSCDREFTSGRVESPENLFHRRKPLILRRVSPSVERAPPHCCLRVGHHSCQLLRRPVVRARHKTHHRTPPRVRCTRTRIVLAARIGGPSMFGGFLGGRGGRGTGGGGRGAKDNLQRGDVNGQGLRVRLGQSRLVWHQCDLCRPPRAPNKSPRFRAGGATERREILVLCAWSGKRNRERPYVCVSE